LGRFLKTSAKTAKSDVTGVFTSSGTTDQRPAVPTVGLVRFNTTNGSLEYYNGTTFENIAVQGTVNITKDSFTGDNSTISYTLSVTPADENNILVFVGNVHQNPDVAYSLSGSTLTFSSPPPDTHTIVVLHGFDSTVV
jgi:hypothetical protein